ncbi:hypothetical protein OUZ56_003791 [Daphnia magna]|uniref:Uncharacterized protein n=1 Tax=Daphnia magna TaxID=35525 RepID=A0ABQ9YMT1_9CRUS|nr:hypothetical protein OUZ56_003791 [Daphnia magna]
MLFSIELIHCSVCIGFETISTFWTANVNLPSVKHFCFDNFCSFAPVDHMQLYFLALPAAFVYVFTSSLSSLTSLPHRCLNLRCSLCHITVFIYTVAFAPSLSSSTL